MCGLHGSVSARNHACLRKTAKESGAEIAAHARDILLQAGCSNACHPPTSRTSNQASVLCGPHGSNLPFQKGNG